MPTAVFGGPSKPNEDVYINFGGATHPITYFVGRNGTGKSKTAAAVTRAYGGRLLATDRLLGLMKAADYGWGTLPQSGYRGVPLGGQERQNIDNFVNHADYAGVIYATQNLYALREQPEVWLKVAAFIRRALGRIIELREDAGYLDPYVRIGDMEYSLLRDEGHGLRELVILLTAVYRSDWRCLVVDEPELHLHPSLARIWIGELEQQCRTTGRQAIIVTHEPSLLRPKSADDLAAIWYFAPNSRPLRISDHVLPVQTDRVTASLQQNPDLISQLVFSPRPVLVEGPHDVAALTASLQRTQPQEVVAQTDFIACGGSGAVALWYEISQKIGLDIKAVADLDACFSPEIQRALDKSPGVVRRYIEDFAADIPKTIEIIRPFIRASDRAQVGAEPRSRGRWLADSLEAEGHLVRKEKLLAIWRDADLWLHPQGTLEDVLGISNKGSTEAAAAAQAPGRIDDVTEWCAYRLDPSGDVFELLGATIERIAHNIMEALRLSPGTDFSQPVGVTSKSDGRLVQVTPIGDGVHRLTVLAPAEFAGYWLEFARHTPSTDLVLREPERDAV
ncbi:AAA family ATPase [Micromonospora sp. WMMD718]|uniref:ATP-dependent nuclease n=1 Tax=Micromonospora TaxID=1873 RepID=UPI00128B8BFF|nr:MULTISPECIES: AAA family ATPase [Micromonospora]MDG4755304.1 AAA family ATPase [Micromonospora sp. WMMD718]